jgi:hypothetical protein
MPRSVAEAVRVMCDEAEGCPNRDHDAVRIRHHLRRPERLARSPPRRRARLACAHRLISTLTIAGSHGLILSPTGIEALAAWTGRAVAEIQSGIDAHVAALTAVPARF